MVFLCWVESSSASLSYALVFDSSRARVSLLEASREEIRDLRLLDSDSFVVEDDLSVAISDSRDDREFSVTRQLGLNIKRMGKDKYLIHGVSSWTPQPPRGPSEPSFSTP